jgi:uncharacterized protein YdaT
MPWTAQSYRSRHNKSLTLRQAKKAAAQANAMLREGVPERIAIATANKHARNKPKTDADRMKSRYGGTSRGKGK